MMIYQHHHLDPVECLHAADVVWPDAKPENFLIDNKGNARLIDLGGSFTRSWLEG